MTLAEFQQRYRYDLSTDRLGGGGFGEVYKAYDTVRDRWVALKISKVNPDFLSLRLKKEVEMVNGLPEHPYVAYYEACYSFPSLDGEYDFGVLQYYEEGNLLQLLDNRDLSQGQKETILKQILEGLDFLHKNGIIHRDLKPQNILIVKRGDEYIPKITDFGISKKLDADRSAVFSNSLVGAGTLAYSSPEQLKDAEIRKNTDLWSFGVIAFRALTGELPFTTGDHGTSSEAGRMELFTRINSGRLPESIDTVKEPWQTVIRRCLVSNADRRAKNCGECLRILKGEGEKIEIKIPSLPESEDTIIVSQPKQIIHQQDLDKRTGAAKIHVPKKKNFKVLLTILVLVGMVLVGLYIISRVLKTAGNNDITTSGSVGSEMISVGKWIQKKDVVPNTVSQTTTFSVGGKAYVVAGEVDNCVFTSEVWEYNPIEDIWTKKKNFPGGKRALMFSFTVGDRAFVGGGWSNKTGAYTMDYNDLWEYHDLADAWTKKKNIPIELFGDLDKGTFSSGNKGYVAIPSEGGSLQLFEYDALNDIWTRKTKIPENVDSIEKGTGIYGEYDLQNKDWLDKTNFPKKHLYRWNFHFVINGKGYFAGIQYWPPSGRENTDEMWEFDPNVEGDPAEIIGSQNKESRILREGDKNREIELNASRIRSNTSDTLHLGRLQGGVAVEYQLQIRNTGSEALTIQSIMVCCGKLHTEYDRHAVKPGETTLVKIKYNPEGEKGRVKHSLEIMTSQDKTPYKIPITADIL